MGSGEDTQPRSVCLPRMSRQKMGTLPGIGNDALMMPVAG